MTEPTHSAAAVTAIQSPQTSGKLAPHPVLAAYYSDETGRLDRVRRWFDTAAGDYDRINQLMSFGTGVWHRQDALRRLGVRPGSRLLDIGSGTGVIAAIAQKMVGDGGLVVAVDPSSGMLGQARARGVQNIVPGRGENLPFADDSFDFLTMGYALRHVSDIDAAFSEYRRVLRPGGRLLLLEIARPNSAFGLRVLRWYMRDLVPHFARSRDAAELMRYYWDTIEHCIPPQTILDRLKTAGFDSIGCKVTVSILREYGAVASKDSTASRMLKCF